MQGNYGSFVDYSKPTDESLPLETRIILWKSAREVMRQLCSKKYFATNLLATPRSSSFWRQVKSTRGCLERSKEKCMIELLINDVLTQQLLSMLCQLN